MTRKGNLPPSSRI